MNDYSIRALDGGTVSITEYDPGKMFFSVTYDCGYSSVVLTANEARALVSALNQAIVECEQQEVAV